MPFASLNERGKMQWRRQRGRKMIQKDVQLVFYEEEEHEASICGYELDVKQKEFTFMPRAALERFNGNGHCTPVVILDGNVPAGFFVLHAGPDALGDPGLEGYMLIRSLSVNPLFQGRGIGQQAMKLLPLFVKKFFPHIGELILLVNDGNDRASYVYKSAGYEDRGIRRQGPKGLQSVLHLSIR